ncbi:MAG: hypothetical protein VST71_07290 [Nitrospirota bacterium]|nr:hypothetical protein [Nitrospirota bacterium]
MKRRLAEAEGYLEEAEYLYKEKLSNLHTLAKLYHAMIYSLFALFDLRDIGGLTHADLIERFERDYVQKGVFDSTVLEAMRFAYDITHECDCAHMKQPEDRDVTRLEPIVRGFVHEVGAVLRGQ